MFGVACEESRVASGSRAAVERDEAAGADVESPPGFRVRAAPGDMDRTLSADSRSGCLAERAAAAACFMYRAADGYDTYAHSSVKTRKPVRSCIDKHGSGRIVL